MNHFILRAGRVLALLAVLLGSATLRTTAQTVNVQILLPDSQLINAADLLDLTNFKIVSAIPTFSIILTTDPPGIDVSEVVLLINMRISLTGTNCSRKSGLYARLRTKPFAITGGQRVLTAFDFGASGELDPTAEDEDQVLKNCIEDHVYNFSTLPAGTYTLSATVVRSVTEDPIGTGTESFVITFGTAQEIQIDLFSPYNGASVLSPFPTFSWNTNADRATLFVYAKLPHHDSVLDAIEDPSALSFEQPLEGLFTFTYPPDAGRPLEENGTFVWFLETELTTLNETIRQKSPVWKFTVATSNPDNTLEVRDNDLLQRILGDLAAEYPGLDFLGLTFEQILLDGMPITATELRTLISRLRRDGVPIDVRRQ